MTGPDRIWAKVHGASTDVQTGQRGLIGGWNEHRRDGQREYLARDGETLAEVRAALDDLLCEYGGRYDMDCRLKSVSELTMIERARAALARMEGGVDGEA